MTRFVVVVALTSIATLAAASARAQDASCAIDGFAPLARSDENALLAQWQGEAIGPFGADAAFDLTCNESHLTVDGAASLAAPLAPTSLSASAGVLSIADAVLSTGESGRVDVTGAAALAGAGLTSADITRVDASTAGAVSLTLAHAALGLNGATVTASAVLVDASGTSTALPSSFTLTSAGAVTSPDGVDAVFAVGAASAQVTANGFALAGDCGAAPVTVDGVALANLRSLVGDAASLSFTGTGVSGTATATQAFDDSGPLVPAAIEVQVVSPLVQVPQGGSLNVDAVVRNNSNKAVAILQEIDVDGCAATAVTPVVDDTLPDFVNVLVGVIQQSGWAAPFVAVALAPVLGVAIVADAFVDVASAFGDAIGDIFCGFFGCDDSSAPPPPTPPVAFPRWLEPGAVATFQIALLPQLGDGDYPVRVRFVGQNYAEVHADFTLRIGQGTVPTSWTCGLGAYGAGDGCDCGCGTADSDCPANAGADQCDQSACIEGYNHLADGDPTTCVNDPTPPAPPAPAPGDADPDSGNGDENFWSCASAPGAFPMGCGAALVALLARRRVRASGTLLRR
ncbi:MAG TPA: hypothetical protein VGO62_01975 [Myxococcota bacterium]